MSGSFFPSIGSIAVKADGLPNDSNDPSAEDQDRPLQEIESLCMKCGEQVPLIVLCCLLISPMFDHRV
jgi:hypothetical protein